MASSGWPGAGAPRVHCTCVGNLKQDGEEGRQDYRLGEPMGKYLGVGSA